MVFSLQAVVWAHGHFKKKKSSSPDGGGKKTGPDAAHAAGVDFACCSPVGPSGWASPIGPPIYPPPPRWGIARGENGFPKGVPEGTMAYILFWNTTGWPWANGSICYYIIGRTELVLLYGQPHCLLLFARRLGSRRYENSIGVEVFFPFGACRTALRNILEKIVACPESWSYKLSNGIKVISSLCL